MRKLVSTMILPLAFLYAAGLAQAQTPAGGEKIGVINIQDAISSTAEGKKAFADLQKKYRKSRTCRTSCSASSRLFRTPSASA